MILHLHDFQDLDVEIDIPEASTIGQLRARLQTELSYNAAHCLFFQNGLQLNDSVVLQPSAFSESNLIVLFNREVFPDKSFPTHQPPSEFRRSRLQEFFVARPQTHDSEERPPARESDRDRRDIDFDPLRFMLRHRSSDSDDAFPDFVADDPEISAFLREMLERGHPRAMIMEALDTSGNDIDQARERLSRAMPFRRFLL
jgi:hypothetical protein